MAKRAGLRAGAVEDSMPADAMIAMTLEAVRGDRYVVMSRDFTTSGFPSIADAMKNVAEKGGDVFKWVATPYGTAVNADSCDEWSRRN